MVAFTDILPDPNNPIGIAANPDPTGREGAGFASLKLSLQQPLVGDRAQSGRVQADIATYSSWMIEIDYNPLTCMDFHPVYSFLLNRRITLNPFYVSLPQYLGQATTTKGLKEGYSKGVDWVLVEEDTSSAIGPEPGELFKFSNHDNVYMVTRVETASEYFTGLPTLTGEDKRVHFNPPLQRAVTNVETINFDNPLIKVMQDGDLIEYELGTDNLFKFSLKLIEVS